MLSGKGGIASKLNKLQETNINTVSKIFFEKIILYFMHLAFYEFFDSAIRFLGFENARRIYQLG